MEKNKKYILLGIFFLFIQIIAIIRNILSDYNLFFWFCDFISFPLAIGFFLKKDNFIKSIVNIGLLAQLTFIGAYFCSIFFGTAILETIPLSSTMFYAISSIFIHLSNTFALIFTYKTKPKMSTLFYSLIFLFLMYTITIMYTTAQQGVNYILSYSMLTSEIIPYYTELWIPIVFFIVVLPTQLIQYIIYLISKNKKN